MRRVITLAVAAALASAFGLSSAQEVGLPKEISGRWLIQSSGRTQTFSLDGIVARGDKTFSAKLTWWATDAKCSLSDEPIVGQVTDAGITFDAKNKCDVSFTAVLDRSDKAWAGTATTTSGPKVVLLLNAR